MPAKADRIIFVDFVQIIREDGKERREAIDRVSASLRDTCKALNIPFVLGNWEVKRGQAKLFDGTVVIGIVSPEFPPTFPPTF